MQSQRPIQIAQLANLAHMSACGLGTLLLGLFVFFFAVAQASPDLLREPQAWVLGLTLAGLLIMWWKDLLGGVLTLCGLALFYGLNFVQSGQLPGGWVFPLSFLPGLLAVIAGLMRSRGRQHLSSS